MVEVSGSVAIGVCDFVLGDDYCGTDLVTGKVVSGLHGLCLFVALFRNNLCRIMRGHTTPYDTDRYWGGGEG